MPIQLGPLHHIGMVVPSLAAARRLHVERFGGVPFGTDIEIDVARIGFVQMPNVLMELIEPIAPDTDLTAFLAAHPGGGQHHLCHAVDDIDAAWASCVDQGVEFLCPITPGVLGPPIFFIRLPELPGLLIEFIEMRF